MAAFARTLGKVFYNVPWPVRRLRDFLLDHTGIPERQINKGYTQDAGAAEGDPRGRRHCCISSSAA